MSVHYFLSKLREQIIYSYIYINQHIYIERKQQQKNKTIA